MSLRPIRRQYVALLFIALNAPRLLLAQSVNLDEQFNQVIVPLLSRHCGQCHTADQAEAMLDLSRFTRAEHVAASHQTWTEIRQRLAAREMPPADADSPIDDQNRQRMVAWIDAFRKQEADRHAGDPGLVPVRRLSNSEFNYSVRDLTGIDIRPTKEFPVDPANEAGFDNSAESLSTSPALLTKSLAAARLVAEHMVLTPDGIRFAPHPVVTETDRDKYCVKRIIDFYGRQRTDYADYFLAAWRIKTAPEQFTIENQTRRSNAETESSSGLSRKYLELLIHMLEAEGPVLPPEPDSDQSGWPPVVVQPPAPSNENMSLEPRSDHPTLRSAIESAHGMGPLAVIRRMWFDLPKDLADVEEARRGCERLRSFIIDLRQRLEPEIKDLNVRGIHKGAQPFVLWKNDQYASYRQRPFLPGLSALAPGADSSVIVAALSVPEQADRQTDFTREVERFCRLFPDAFYISERGRDYVGKPKGEQEKGRLLSAGFHSMMGYYRDDEPLVKLMLSPAESRQLDRLWQELDFITSAPMRQYAGFVWFERTDSSTMRGAEFDFARAEDKSVTTPEMIQRLATTYLAKADRLGADEIPRAAIENYFRRMNAQIQWVEEARRLAEPHHVEALIALAERAFRRDLTSQDRAELRAFYERLRHRDGLSHEEAMQDLLVSILVSPEFNFRIDLASKSAGLQQLSQWDLASRLSYFLWSSLPDDELRALVRQQRLSDPQELRLQVKRMLADGRMAALATEFGGQWLDFRRFEEHNSVDRDLFPQFNDQLRSAMFQEPIRFLQHMIEQDRSVLECLSADYVIVNRSLAAHYGYPTEALPTDEAWQILPATQGRGGLLTMGVFLTQNAPGRRTSPVKRGYWVVRRLLGERIPPPPPNVPDLPTDEASLGSLTLRETLARHREHASCAGCHNRFDSIGLVFENYGPIGQLRDRDLAGKPIDTQAVFPNGQTGHGVDGLKQYLTNHRQDEFIDNLARKLLSFALGRTLLLSDEPLIQQMKSNLRTDGYRFGSLVETVVLSPQFLSKRGR